MPTIWEYIESFEKRFGTEAMRVQSRALQVDYLSQLTTPLPEVAAKGLEVAKRFHNGTASNEERSRARKNCWGSLVGKNDWASNTPEDFIVLAVIGALDDFKRKDREPEGEHIEWFFCFVEKFEGYQRKKFEAESPKEEAFLKQYFPMTDTAGRPSHWLAGWPPDKCNS